MSKLKLATVWLDGCSGCHMSFLDMDERLLKRISRERRPHAGGRRGEQRRRSAQDSDRAAADNHLVSLGDCAVTANVPGMRNSFGVKAVYDRAYRENVTFDPGIPNQVVPALLPYSRPVHEIVTVDVFVPGCPPSADTIFYVLTELLEGRQPDVSLKTRFGS
jgi:NAD-reducing hydrogenase small subunit